MELEEVEWWPCGVPVPIAVDDALDNWIDDALEADYAYANELLDEQAGRIPCPHGVDDPMSVNVVPAPLRMFSLSVFTRYHCVMGNSPIGGTSPPKIACSFISSPMNKSKSIS